MDKIEQIKNLYANYDPKEIGLSGDLVLGAGSTESPPLAFIGEAPGQLEDLKRQPFVGRAGVVLNGLLRGVGIPRKEVYITNVVKVRPPRNSTPNEQQIKYSLNFLWQELDLVNPSIIVTLGRTAQQALLPVGVREMGKLITTENRRFFCCYHPASTLYDATGAKKAELREQFRQLWRILSSS
jgi:uracil-DNA glycosylase